MKKPPLLIRIRKKKIANNAAVTKTKDDDDGRKYFYSIRKDSFEELYENESLKDWTASCVVVCLVGVVYLNGVIQFARANVLAEAIIAFFFPFLGWIFYSTRQPHQFENASYRQKELIIIESIFNLLVVFLKYNLKFGFLENKNVADSLFVLFFSLQTFGFLRSEARSKRPICFLRSITLFIGIILQFLLGKANIDNNSVGSKSMESLITSDGRFLVFGFDAPNNLKLHYGFWLLGVLYIDYSHMLPHAALHLLHFCSYVLAVLSGEFWHVRLLTASHLFVIDAVLWLRAGITVAETPIARIPKAVLNLYAKYLPFVNLFSLFGCLACVLTSFYCGEEKILCTSVNIFPKALV